MEEFYKTYYKTSEELNEENLLESKEFQILNCINDNNGNNNNNNNNNNCNNNNNINPDNNNCFNILVGRTENYLIIRNLYYEIRFSKEEFSKLTNILFSSINECYEYIKHNFEQNLVFVTDKTKMVLKLNILISDPKQRKDIYIKICLKPQFKNEDIIHELIEQNKILKEENNEMKKDVEMFKEIFGLVDRNNPPNQGQIENINNQNQMSQQIMQLKNMFQAMIIQWVIK